MKPELRKKLAAAGLTTGDAADFFGLSDEQRQLLDARVAIAKAIRQERKAQNITQKRLAMRLHSTQPRVAKIETAAPDVSLDQMLRALAVLGGGITVHGPVRRRKAKRDK